MKKIENKPLRIIFAGTTNFSAHHLNSIIHHTPHKIIAVLTQQHLPHIYEKFIFDNSVREIAAIHKLPILQPSSLHTKMITKIIKNLNPDVMIVVSYGLIIPNNILNIPPLGCINVHGSLLPRWRGAAPIQRAIEAGDTETGISIIQMDSGIDTGNILYKITCTISPQDTSLSLFKKLTHVGTTALLQTLLQITTGNCNIIPQDNTLATYAKKINKNEGKINWDISTVQLTRKIRAFNPWPVTYFQIYGKKIKIWEAKINNIRNVRKNIAPGTILSTQQSRLIVATNDGSLNITLIQEEGKKIIPTKEFLNSKKHWFTIGDTLKD